MTLKKKQKGFTLVEVIVVAVIVAILAAVAIPLYTGYIKDSRSNSANNVAGSLASGLGAYYQTTGSNINARSYSGETIDLGTDNKITIPGDVECDVTTTTVRCTPSNNKPYNEDLIKTFTYASGTSGSGS